MSNVLEILIAKSAGAKMEPQQEAHAIPGQGLIGDRYFVGGGAFSPNNHRPDYELTLIEHEKLVEFANVSGLAFTSLDARRNIVTSGVSLNDLVGREFHVGDVLIKGHRLCEPCNYLAKMTYPEVLQGLLHKGGLRAQILTEGTIRVGDPIRIEQNR